MPMKLARGQASPILLLVIFFSSTMTNAQERGLRLPISGGPTYPGTGGLPSRNINDANFAGNVPMLSGSPSQILQQNFPIQIKGGDADTYMPPALLERALGPLVAPMKEIHLQ